jgi:hypothetical protein
MTKSEKLKELFNDYAKGFLNIMDLIPLIEALYGNDDDLSFKINSITKDRRIKGTTTIIASCVKTKKVVTINILNIDANNRQLVRQKLIEAHKLCSLINNEPELKEDDII